ncbi:hypothetical protein [Pacificibacter sp.]|uniref:hypothetical protein n=1 Tax=Pacificibacter sp. TaxID=1917866 RepID=UPI003218F838
MAKARVEDWIDQEDIEPKDLISADLLKVFANLAGFPSDGLGFEATKTALTSALEAFMWARLEQEALHPESAENKALDAAAQDASQLYDKLLLLQDYSGLEKRVEASIRSNPNLYEFDDGKTLRDLISTRRNIFRAYRELLVDLQVCLENTSNRQPKRHVIEDPDNGAVIELETDEEYAARMKTWRARSKERALPKDHALREFLRSLAPYWEANSPHPFTEGMYFKEANQTVSQLVDAVEIIMLVASPNTTRQQIVTAIRDVRSSLS